MEQKEGERRVTIVNGGRDGPTAVRLHTEPGDNNVSFSGAHERAALALTQVRSDCYQGREQWWEVSMLFPDDFVYSPGTWHATTGFHGTPALGSGNLQVHVQDGKLQFIVNGGVNDWNAEAVVRLGPVTKNMWYDLVFHAKWSDGSDGFIKAWINGTQYMDYAGPTLYENEGCYFKVNNYHPAFGQPTSIIFDRIIRRDVRQ